MRRFQSGVSKIAYCGHAEMILMDRLGKLRPGEVINVVRFTQTGRPSMAKPCKWCQEYLKKSGASRVRFSNWDGEWEKMKL